MFGCGGVPKSLKTAHYHVHQLSIGKLVEDDQVVEYRRADRQIIDRWMNKSLHRWTYSNIQYQVKAKSSKIFFDVALKLQPDTRSLKSFLGLSH